MNRPDLRLCVAMKVDELADLIWQARDETTRDELHTVAICDLADRMEAGAMRDTSALRDAFVEVAQGFWQREGLHSVRADKPHLRLLTDADFDDLIEEGANA